MEVDQDLKRRLGYRIVIITLIFSTIGLMYIGNSYNDKDLPSIVSEFTSTLSIARRLRLSGSNRRLQQNGQLMPNGQPIPRAMTLAERRGVDVLGNRVGAEEGMGVAIPRENPALHNNGVSWGKPGQGGTSNTDNNMDNSGGGMMDTIGGDGGGSSNGVVGGVEDGGGAAGGGADRAGGGGGAQEGEADTAGVYNRAGDRTPQEQELRTAARLKRKSRKGGRVGGLIEGMPAEVGMAPETSGTETSGTAPLEAPANPQKKVIMPSRRSQPSNPPIPLPVATPLNQAASVKPLSSLASLLDDSPADASSITSPVPIPAADGTVYLKDIVLDEGDQQCVAKKRLVVDLNLSGLGNRMLALVSASLLAIMMDRVLEIDWQANKMCGFTLKELFAPKPVDTYLPRPFVFEVEFKREFKHMGSGMLASCTTQFNQFDYDALYFVKDKQLFDRLNNKCDVIFVNSNLYYVDALYNTNLMGEPASLMRSQFPHAFKDIANVIFQARPDVAEMGDSFINEKLKGKKWISFHGRQFTNGGVEYMDSFICISRLLANGELDAVFVTAESSKLTDLAYDTIPDKEKVFSMERSTVHRPKGNVDARTAEMQVAMLQWYMMNKAPYCMTNLVKASTFALTAMVSGACEFILVQAHGECSLQSPLEDKEKLLASTPKLVAMPGLTPDRREKIWSTVKQTNKLVSGEECFKKSKGGAIKPVTPYWLK